MTNVFNVHILGRRKMGDQEEARLKLFNLDGTPLPLRDLTGESRGAEVLVSAWKGVYDETRDYEAGSLVRREGSTYLALADAPHTGIGPGETVQLDSATVPASGSNRPAFLLPSDFELDLTARVPTDGVSFEVSFWFKISGTPGDELTFAVLDGPKERMHFYGADGYASWQGELSLPSPQTVTIPGDGWFGLEVNAECASIQYTGPEESETVLGNPWVRFA